MLQPDYFNDKADELIEIYNGLETFIMQDIAMRILKCGEVSGTMDRELWKLEQMGLSRQRILKELSRLTGMTESNLRTLLEDAILTSWADEKAIYDALGLTTTSPLESALIMSTIDAEWKKTKGELYNLTLTTLNQSQADLIRLLNEVDFKVATGMQSYSSAICEVLDRYGQSGTMVYYPSGSRRSLESAVRCAVVTSMNQTAAQVSNQYIADNQIEYVWVSEHFGARYDKNNPTGVGCHEWWQGRAYKIVGSEEGFPNLLESTGYDIDVTTGEGKVVNPLGLHGYNCRHTHGAWAKELGTVRQKIDSEESRRIYDLQQKQRAMERSIRHTKKELLMKQMEVEQYPDDVNLQMEYQGLAKRLSDQNAKYNEFCKSNDLQTQSERLQVAGFGRSESAKAKIGARYEEKYRTLYKGVPQNWVNNGRAYTSIKAINPTHSEENCANCIVAYEMRQRGFNVISNPVSVEKVMKKPWKAWKDVQLLEDCNRDDIISIIRAYNGNCRYGVAFKLNKITTRGHCVVIEKYDSTISVVDVQNGLRYTLEEYPLPDTITVWETMNDSFMAELSDLGAETCRTH